MEALYKFEWEIYRMGSLCGLFLAEKEDVKNFIKADTTIDFGEVLGKHSEIQLNSASDFNFIMLSDDPNFISECKRMNLFCGYNPIQMWKEQKEEEN